MSETYGPYTVHRIPKKTPGKVRIIEAPSEELKAEQRRLLKKLEKTVYVAPFAHAFMHGRGITTMAKHHAGKEFVIAVDLSDFFPSVNEDHLEHLRFKPGVTAAERTGLINEIKKSAMYSFPYDKPHEERGSKRMKLRLPQGSPCSPYISNAVLDMLDFQMAHMCGDLGVEYSRYADDAVFSGKRENCFAMMNAFKELISTRYKLKVNDRKTKLYSRKRRQLVVGLTVNDKVQAPKPVRRMTRASVFNERLFAALVEQGVPEKALASFFWGEDSMRDKLKEARRLFPKIKLKQALARAHDEGFKPQLSMKTAGFKAFVEMAARPVETMSSVAFRAAFVMARKL